MASSGLLNNTNLICYSFTIKAFRRIVLFVLYCIVIFDVTR